MIAYRELQSIENKVPQSSSLGPLLSFVYGRPSYVPSFLPIYTISADDRVILASYRDPTVASECLQSNVNELTAVEEWKIKAVKLIKTCTLY